MNLKERIYSVLLVSASEKFNTSLCALLPENAYFPIQTVSSIAQAQRAVADRDYDLIFVNTPLPDDFGVRFSLDISSRKGAAVLLLIKSEMYDEISAKAIDGGVMTLRKPISVSVMLQTLDFMCATRERLRGFEKKAVSLEDKMAEIRLVNRAKWALIEALKMTEADAHRYIEKQAMNRCVTKREIAESILQTYKS